MTNEITTLAAGACEVGKWERIKTRTKMRWQRRMSTLLFGKHTRWFYDKYLGESGPLVGEGPTFNSHWYYLSEAFWCHICGSHDMALEYAVRAINPNYKSKKWRI